MFGVAGVDDSEPLHSIAGAKRLTIGVFGNNKPAYHCYKAAGFQEYSERNIFLLGENWRCIEMECRRQS